VENTASSNESHDLLSDRELVERLRARDPDAIDEFVRRFEPLVTRYAQWLRIEADERNHWVAELLYDVALTMGRGAKGRPRQLKAYVAGACRLRALEHRGREATYRARIVEALRDVQENSSELREVVVTSLSSERSLRDARGPDWEPLALSPVLERLVNALEDGAAPDERQMLQWLGDQVSYTHIAERLGITRPAAVSRIQRLRAKLIGAALRFGSTLGRAERAEFVRFLRRTGAVAQEKVNELSPNEKEPREDSR
jgi:DNA-directed RNA polymerase specialized sigma24 family protein